MSESATDSAQTVPVVSTANAPVPAVVVSPYPTAAAELTQLGPEGIRYDFNDGCRLLLPTRTSGLWRARLTDLDTGNVLFENESTGAQINSSKRWFVRFKIEVWALDEGAAGPVRDVFSHELDLVDQAVMIQFPVGTLGDSLAWFPYCDAFARAHPQAKVTVALSSAIIPLLKHAYQNLTLLTHEEVKAQALVAGLYATYSVGLFFNDVECNHQPVDFRHVGLHRTAGQILGVGSDELRARLALADESRPIAERYVCIAVQATSAAKTWANPLGWAEVVKFLKNQGYRVLCIDQKTAHGDGLYWTQIPHGAEDATGMSLSETARYLMHAEFFVGLSSGLSWLAWCAGATTVLISGFSLPSTEFSTPYRVINWHTCNGCWSDPALRFDHKDFLWCPRHANTPRQFECTRLITAEHVIRVMKTLPQVQAATVAAASFL